MLHLIDIPKIVTSLVITTIIGGATWYVATQVRLNNIEQKTHDSAELRDAVNRLVIELSHTNNAVQENANNSKTAVDKMTSLREESIVGYMSLKSIVVVQESLIKSVGSLNTSVTELRTLMNYRNPVAMRQTPKEDSLIN